MYNKTLSVKMKSEEASMKISKKMKSVEISMKIILKMTYKN